MQRKREKVFSIHISFFDDLCSISCNIMFLSQLGSDYPNAGILNAGIFQIIIIFEENERFCCICLFFDDFFIRFGRL